MGTRVINVAPGVPSSRQRVVLDGREYVIGLHWSQREAKWYLALFNANGGLLLGGVKLVVNWPLLYKWRQRDGLPPGELMALDGRTPPADPGLDELGDAVSLVYVEASGA